MRATCFVSGAGTAPCPSPLEAAPSQQSADVVLFSFEQQGGSFFAAAEAIAAAAEAAEAAEVSLTRPRLPFRFWFRLRTGRDGAIVFGLPVR